MSTTSITRRELELELAKRKFTAFLSFVKIQNTDTDGSAEMAFEPWPHLMESAEILEKHRRIIFLKARQIGITWLMASYALWVAVFHAGAVVLILSKGENEAKVFLKRIKFVHSRLPRELQGSIVIDSTTEFGFESESKVLALPATEEAGRSETATLVIQDEADYHKHLEHNFAAVRPTVDAGGQHIMASTSNYETMDSFFNRQYRRANTLEGNVSQHDGESRYVKVFFGWDVRPGRDAEWRSEMTADYEDDQRDKEYPETEEQALAPPQAIAAFDPAVINDMLDEVQEPLRLTGIPPDARIWQKFSIGNKYAAFTDTSHGTGKDFAVTIVLNCTTGLVVADIVSNLIDPDELADQSVKLLNMYDNPIWGIEDNDWGIQTIKKAQQLNYKRLYHRPASAQNPNKKGQVGWHTDETRRKSLYGDLQQAIKDRAVTMLARDGLAQFQQTIKNPAKQGRIEAIEGGHDDYPLAVGGALQMITYARKARGFSFTPPDLGQRTPTERVVQGTMGRRW